MDRRAALKTAIGVGMTAIAGCYDSSPEPRTVNVVVAGKTFTNTAEVKVTLENEGSGGEVNVFVEIYDGDTLLKRYGKTIYMKSGERRRVSTWINTEDVDGVEAEAHPA